MPDEFGRLVGDETPDDPPTFREWFVQVIARILGVDLLDAHVTRGMSRREQRLQSRRLNEMRDKQHEMLEKSFFDEPDVDVVAHHMWLVMRGDETVNPPVTLSGQRNDDGSWNHDVDAGPEDSLRHRRKHELLHQVDQMGFIDPVLSETEEQTHLSE